MTIKYLHGDLLRDSSEAYVNTVNCVGVMGKGIALEFKRRWIGNYNYYKEICNTKKLRPGKMLVWENDYFIPGEPKYVINFPTKDHWRNSSELKFIEDGLDDLKIVIEKYNIKSIALPPLGCGNGGLDWDVVKPLIVSKLIDLHDVAVNLYIPFFDHDLDPPEQHHGSIKMTYERALLVKAVAAAEPYFFGEIDQLSLQKIAYLLQQLGVGLNIDFSKNLWGPYSERLKLAFRSMEKMNIFSQINGEARSVHVTPSGYAAADEYIQKNELDEHPVEQLIQLIEGFENPYGLELLANIHMILQFADENELNDLLVTKSRRSHYYKSQEISSGLKRLREFDLI